MKKLFIFLLCAGIGGSAIAQKEVSAKTIFEAIDQGKAVNYEGVTITGNLDLTELSNKKRIKKSKGYEEYKSYVEVPITFRNCVFKNDFIAYKNSENEKGGKWGNTSWSIGEGATSTTDFERSVTIENCTFEAKSEFKYSDFADKASFAGTKFQKEANFKYAGFKKESNFANCRFGEYANFKYSDFKYDADFFSADFRNYADFKYANFNERVTFKGSTFNNNADFKYAEFKDSGNFDNTRFRSGIDMKYSNGKKYIN
ncbi:pentapeptide repeat-containing protein [Emticicia sp. 21SJ11W-3]|uniref:pentapeptide repeat-containing protein n=1 Tax=Emticicia sp. 21SJ11W-3 TaxID=2916755 RepID=UPI00209E74A0|nr:pentapeptide repeat-containing protein [Emticicia sp. 21SJ11W-3]UTA68547.1 pentapeptide repeat-containing protein [Emticicia sp. 21SJ11W-3]